MQGRLLIAISIIICILFIFSGCMQEKVIVADKNGEMFRYSIEDIYKDKMYGFYVKNKDETFSPVMQDIPGFETSGFGYMGSYDEIGRYIWWTNTADKKGNIIDHDKLTPTVTEKTPLVAIFETSSDMPEEYVIEQYENLGYTVGVKISISEDGRDMLMSTRESCPGASVNEVLSEAGGDEFIKIVKINKSKDLPFDNVDTDINNLLGFQKNKYYEFTVYIGTTTRDYTVKADTQIFKARTAITLDSPLKETSKQYFIVNLPANMKKGHYCINDIGMFKYDPDATTIKVTKD